MSASPILTNGFQARLYSEYKILSSTKKQRIHIDATTDRYSGSIHEMGFDTLFASTLQFHTFDCKCVIIQMITLIDTTTYDLKEFLTDQLEGVKLYIHPLNTSNRGWLGNHGTRVATCCISDDRYRIDYPYIISSNVHDIR
ncbi:hypothetical protein CLF_103576 [Clonorchis sinensis]|uniref:Uncharacterized protein n=1 Tax=Clonorchis sinensis TaxID=79923 RepID=G7Y9Y6_CLOSI|nr:hypothetical protein CLF_103576 [Clonorchis sinensis]